MQNTPTFYILRNEYVKFFRIKYNWTHTHRWQPIYEIHISFRMNWMAVTIYVYFSIYNNTRVTYIYNFAKPKMKWCVCAWKIKTKFPVALYRILVGIRCKYWSIFVIFLLLLLFQRQKIAWELWFFRLFFSFIVTFW